MATMILWVIFALMTAAAIFAVVWPLGRPPRASAGGSDLAVYKDQLLKFTLLTKKNLRDIQALPNDDSVPLDPQLRYNATRAYQLIRAAQWGMGVAIQVQSYPDPILGLAQKRAEEAWNLARYPVDFTGVSRAEYISMSVQNLSRSLRLAQQALVMLP